MGLLSLIFNELLYRPLFNFLVFFYNIIPGHDFGVAIIALTILVRLALYPLSQKAIESQKTLSELQPKIKEIQKKYQKDKAEQTKAIMEFYRQNKINPFSGCLPLLIQFPVFIGLYKTFWSGLDPSRLNSLYSFISNPGAIDPMFFNIINLSAKNPYLAILAGVFQFIQSKMMIPKNNKSADKTDMSSIMGKQMTYLFPFITVFIVWNFPAGLPLYWVISTLFSIGQQYLVLKKQKIKTIKNID